MRSSFIVILHNLRSAYNVGSIFRTADAVGASKIYLTGYTPAPIDRFGHANTQIAKTALGAEQTVSWESIPDFATLSQKLKASSYKLIALEQADNSTDYRQVKLVGPTAVVVGNEVEGVPAEVLKLCDVVAEIPMRGSKESLNVAVATGVLLFRLLD